MSEINEHEHHHGHCHDEHCHDEHCHEENGCCCCHEHDNDDGYIRKGIIRIIAGLIALGFAVFTQGPVSIVLYITAYLIFGYDVVLEAVENILGGHLFDENFLMSLATICALAIGEYTEAVAVMLFYQIGEFLQGAVVNRSRRSIKDLMELNIDDVNILKDGNIVTVEAEDVEIGDIVVINPGDKIPVDGVITQGTTSLDMKSLTGESVPVEKAEGDSVISGSVNNASLIYVKAEKKYSDSTVSRIMDMVENASSHKSETESFISRFAGIYTPIVVFAAVAVALIPTLLGYDFKTWLYRALIFLVASCPCALVVSIPLTFFAGIGTLSRKGVLVKGSNFVELLSKTDTVVMDKTGTITKGEFEVTDVTGEDTLKYAASLERFSTHPMGAAVVDKYKGEYFEAEDVKNITGFGLSGIIDGKTILVGSKRLMDSENISCNNGYNIYVALEGRCIGAIAVEDTVKPDSKNAVEGLNLLGIANVAMLTGDKKEIADKIANEVGIKNVYSELLPQDKVSAIETLYGTGSANIAAIGDGINDAPVLARADIGIAMGGIGSDAAIEAADVVIMEDSLAKLPVAIRLARATMKLCRENVAFVLAIKIIVLILAVIGKSNMWLAVFADVGVALLAVLNSIRITRM